MVNNRLLPTPITDRNGNYIQIAYKPDCFQVGTKCYCGYFAPMAIDYVIDTLGRVIRVPVRFQLQTQRDHPARVRRDHSESGHRHSRAVLLSNSVAELQLQRVDRRASRLARILRLKHIYFPATGTGYLPTYSQYGMVITSCVRAEADECRNVASYPARDHRWSRKRCRLVQLSGLGFAE